MTNFTPSNNTSNFQIDVNQQFFYKDQIETLLDKGTLTKENIRTVVLPKIQSIAELTTDNLSSGDQLQKKELLEIVSSAVKNLTDASDLSLNELVFRVSKLIDNIHDKLEKIDSTSRLNLTKLLWNNIDDLTHSNLTHSLFQSIEIAGQEKICSSTENPILKTSRYLQLLELKTNNAVWVKNHFEQLMPEILALDAHLQIRPLLATAEQLIKLGLFNQAIQVAILLPDYMQKDLFNSIVKPHLERNDLSSILKLVHSLPKNTIEKAFIQIFDNLTDNQKWNEAKQFLDEIPSYNINDYCKLLTKAMDKDVILACDLVKSISDPSLKKKYLEAMASKMLTMNYRDLIKKIINEDLDLACDLVDALPESPKKNNCYEVMALEMLNKDDVEMANVFKGFITDSHMIGLLESKINSDLKFKDKIYSAYSDEELKQYRNLHTADDLEANFNRVVDKLITIDNGIRAIHVAGILLENLQDKSDIVKLYSAITNILQKLEPAQRFRAINAISNEYIKYAHLQKALENLKEYDKTFFDEIIRIAQTLSQSREGIIFEKMIIKLTNLKKYTESIAIYKLIPDTELNAKSRAAEVLVRALVSNGHSDDALNLASEFPHKMYKEELVNIYHHYLKK